MSENNSEPSPILPPITHGTPLENIVKTSEIIYRKKSISWPLALIGILHFAMAAFIVFKPNEALSALNFFSNLSPAINPVQTGTELFWRIPSAMYFLLTSTLLFYTSLANKKRRLILLLLSNKIIAITASLYFFLNGTHYSAFLFSSFYEIFFSIWLLVLIIRASL